MMLFAVISIFIAIPRIKNVSCLDKSALFKIVSRMNAGAESGGMVLPHILNDSQYRPFN